VHTVETRKTALLKVQTRRAIWIEVHGPCKVCGSTEQLRVGPIDPSVKLAHAFWSWSDEKRSAELAKCRVLCISCLQKQVRSAKPLKHGITSYRSGCRCAVCRMAGADSAARRAEVRRLRKGTN
jgi:hypothetical protein